MVSRKTSLFFLCLPLACLLPLLFLHMGGAAVAGLVSGFVTPLEHPFHVMIFLGVAIAGFRLQGNATLALPLCFAMMMLIGAGSDIAIQEIPSSKMMMFGAVMIYAFAMGAAHSRQFLPVAAIASAAGFYFGAQYATTLPDIASMGWFLLGVVSSALLVMMAALSLAVMGFGYWPRLGEKLKELPALGSFLSLF